jgi:hypothetical protein
LGAAVVSDAAVRRATRAAGEKKKGGNILVV